MGREPAWLCPWQKQAAEWRVVEPGTSWHLPAQVQRWVWVSAAMPLLEQFSSFRVHRCRIQQIQILHGVYVDSKSIPYLSEIHISWGIRISSGHCLWASLSSFLKWAYKLIHIIKVVGRNDLIQGTCLEQSLVPEHMLTKVSLLFRLHVTIFRFV